MTTKLDKPLKREIDIDGKPFTLTLTATGLLLTEKGHRKGIEVSWKSLVGGDAAMAAALQASVHGDAD